jgi:hypothetical protein
VFLAHILLLMGDAAKPTFAVSLPAFLFHWRATPFTGRRYSGLQQEALFLSIEPFRLYTSREAREMSSRGKRSGSLARSPFTCYTEVELTVVIS